MNPEDQWFMKPRADADGVQVLCAPYAGGGASIYRNWPDRIGALEVSALQPPGRENRLREREPSDFPSWAHQAAQAVVKANDEPVVVFGHCMGALTAHALVTRLERIGHPVRALVVSSSRVPHLPPSERYLPPMPDSVGVYHMSMSEAELAAEFAKVMQAQGVDLPEELLPLAVGVLQRDLAMCFAYRPDLQQVTCPIVTVGWEDDSDVRPDEMQRWAECGPVTAAHVLPGHKMSFLQAPPELRDVIASTDRVNPNL